MVAWDTRVCWNDMIIKNLLLRVSVRVYVCIIVPSRKGSVLVLTFDHVNTDCRERMRHFVDLEDK